METLTETLTTTMAMDHIEVSTSNEMFRRPNELTEVALKDLADSIRQHGVLQSIVVRPHPAKLDYYILICGERRFRASQIAGLQSIPVTIQNVTEEVALIFQITENMQREDVHPLNEAKGFKTIMESDPNLNTAELALRFGKSESYILLRLKLNDLVKEGAKDFYANKMQLGHALILSRLTPAYQKETIQYITQQGSYSTVNKLQEYIERNIVNSLSSVPFDKNDELLHKKAGSCLNCPKRSGASPLLFAEIKKKDKCFDRSCFENKCNNHLVNTLKTTIESKPDMMFLSPGHPEASLEVLALIGEHEIKPLEAYNEFWTHDTGGKKIKGMWISGSNAGKIEKVYLKKTAKESNGVASDDVTLKVERINQRLERGKELDREKVHAQILEALRKHPSQKKSFNKKMIPDEEVMLWYMILDKSTWTLRSELCKQLGLDLENSNKLYNSLRKLTPEEKALMVRKVMMDQYGSNQPESNHGFLVYTIANAYKDIDITGFENNQKVIAEKREGNAKERIKQLKDSVK